MKHKADDSLIDLAGKKTKPIMSKDVEEAVLDAMVMHKSKTKWKLWGMDTIRKQGSAILLQGPPGTGKNTIADWMCKRIGKGKKDFDISKVGGGDPGQTEKGVRELFADARARNNMTVVIDECNSIFGDRLKSSDDTWKISTTETVMTEINIYPGTVIAMTNHPDMLDPALADRFMSIIEVGMPDKLMRVALWKQKLPIGFPIQFSDQQLQEIADHELSGRQIENVLIKVGSHCIRKELQPKMLHFNRFIKIEQAKHIGSEGEV